MKRILPILILLASATVAHAQSASPIQQYLQSETGYAPQQANQAPAPVQATQNPYNVAQTPPPYPYAAAVDNVPAESDNRNINTGVSGMNN